jgi:hypothetical protein
MSKIIVEIEWDKNENFNDYSIEDIEELINESDMRNQCVTVTEHKCKSYQEGYEDGRMGYANEMKRRDKQ